MLDRVLEEYPNLDFKIALAWVINAKNSLSNCHGFSSFQLSIGQNPSLRHISQDKLPALTMAPSSDVLRQNLNALHSARVAFMESERSEKLRRALALQTRTYSDVTYLNGDTVFYKRKDSHKWRGPATVLGKDGQQVLIKHGGFLIRVHPCRLQLARNQNADDSKKAPDGDSQSNNQDNDSDSSPEDTEPTTPQNSSYALRSASTPVNLNIKPTIDLLNPLADPPKETQVEVPVVNQPSDQQLDSGSPKLTQLKRGKQVDIRLHSDPQWSSATLHSRSGKATGKWANSWNIQTSDGIIRSVDFSKDVSEWRFCDGPNTVSTDNNLLVLQGNTVNHPEIDSEILYHSTFIASVDQDITDAKQRELNAWKSEHVYDVVPDEGQKCINVRWVITPKMIDGVPSTKARLCAKGFQEESNFRTDSPTCSRESIRLLCALTAAHKWKLNSIDIRAAFLQGSTIDRIVFIKPPPEANTTNIWQLQKCVYGLADAPRHFYLRLRDELIQLQVTPCSYDHGLYFYYFQSKFSGILVCHVDDMMWSGEEVFESQVIKPLRQKLKFGSENSTAFQYVGIEIQQHPDFSITMNQKNFAQSIQKLAIPTHSDKTELLNDTNLQHLRSRIGQLNWLANVSRPEISFEVCYLSGIMKNATVADLIAANKVITNVQNNPSYMTFPPLDLSSLYVKTYADGSFGSLTNGGSQGGVLVVLCDKYQQVSPIGWCSARLKRVVRSALAAETLAMCNGCEMAFMIAQTIKQILSIDNLPVETVTDSQSLFETLGSTKQPTSRRLLIEISALREMVNEGEIKVNLVPGSKQISDPLTKRGAAWSLLQQVLQSGLLP